MKTNQKDYDELKPERDAVRIVNNALHKAKTISKRKKVLSEFEKKLTASLKERVENGHPKIDAFEAYIWLIVAYALVAKKDKVRFQRCLLLWLYAVAQENIRKKKKKEDSQLLKQALKAAFISVGRREWNYYIQNIFRYPVEGNIFLKKPS